MGGLGSGNWNRWQGKKSTVEESLVISMKDLRKQLVADSTGTITWNWTNGNTSSIRYHFADSYDGPIVQLIFVHNDLEEVRIPVRITTTPTQFGRPRFWLICPLTVRGIDCNRRVAKLYLPPEAKYFGCRKCHDLTYRSSQEAHRAERMGNLFQRSKSPEQS